MVISALSMTFGRFPVLSVVFLFWLLVASDWMRNGPLWEMVFTFLWPVLVRFPSLGRVLNVQYVNSNEWESDRASSRVAVKWITYILNLPWEFGNVSRIKALSQRQRLCKESFELVEGLRVLLNQRLSMAEVELHLVRFWVRELPRMTGIKPPQDENAVVASILHQRHALAKLSSNPIAGIWFIAWNWTSIRYVSVHYLPTLNHASEEPTLFMGPLFTTIDTTLCALVDREPLQELHQIFRYVPIRVAAVACSDHMVIMTLKNNERNNSSNSVFGAKGFMCPGSAITFTILRSIKDVRDCYQVSVTGEPCFSRFGFLKNSADVYIVMSERCE